MKLTEVAIVAVDGFSPFHYSVPCMLFGDTVSETKRFNLHICAERPGLLSARDGFALNASGDFSLLEQADTGPAGDRAVARRTREAARLRLARGLCHRR